ncbi:MAG: hypothetical protein NVS1B10_02830 [Candidatus Saccharimonadales bacterium]
MTPVVILGSIVVVPILLIMLLRINAALVFLSLCLGDVLVQFLSKDTGAFVSLYSARLPAQAANPSTNTINIALISLPAILTALFMIRSIHSKSRLVLNIFPAIGVGLLAALLIVPLLSSGLSHNIFATSFWRQANRAQALIVGGSALTCLVVIWLQRPKTPKHKSGKHQS